MVANPTEGQALVDVFNTIVDRETQPMTPSQIQLKRRTCCSDTKPGPIVHFLCLLVRLCRHNWLFWRGVDTATPLQPLKSDAPAGMDWTPLPHSPPSPSLDHFRETQGLVNFLTLDNLESRTRTRNEGLCNTTHEQPNTLYPDLENRACTVHQ